MTKQLPARPNLDHLKGQAKKLLAQLKRRDPKHKLADAQTVVAREAGFASWPKLVRHVDQLRALEGEWRFSSLEVDGNAVPGDMLAHSRILIDGDRFRTESPEGTWEGIFTIDVEASPARIDIEFVDGPDAGETCFGIFAHDGEALVMCLGVVGATRPEKLATRAGSGHALERLHRASKARPANVQGGTPPPRVAEPAPERADAAAFDAPITPLVRRLQGEWSAVELVMDGKPMPEQWLAHGVRRMKGNELEVVFGGQKMVHAKVRIDDSVQPIAVDYLALSGKAKGTITRGIMDWIGDEPRFWMAPAGAPRPAEFPAKPGKGTLSRWRKRG